MEKKFDFFLGRNWNLTEGEGEGRVWEEVALVESGALRALFDVKRDAPESR